MNSGTNTVATMIHGPTLAVKSVTDGALVPACCAASIEIMKWASERIAQSQQTPTTASAPSLTEALISPGCSSPCSMTLRGGRCVSGAVNATTMITSTSPAITK